MYKKVLLISTFILINIFILSSSKVSAAWLSINNNVDWQLNSKEGSEFTYLAGASLGIQPSDYFALTFDFDKTISNKAWGFNRFSVGIISQSMINPKSYDYYPYIGIGIGFIYATDSVDMAGANPAYEKANMSGYGISVPIMAGIRFNVLSFLLTLDIRYTYANATLTYQYGSNRSIYRDLSSFTASLGIGYLF